MDTLEHEWIGREEQVEQAVDKRHVDRDEQDDRLASQHPQRAAKVLLKELAQIYFDFFLLCVDAPVLSAATELRGLADEDDRWVGFLEEEQIQAEGHEAED